MKISENKEVNIISKIELANSTYDLPVLFTTILQK